MGSQRLSTHDSELKPDDGMAVVVTKALPQISLPRQRRFVRPALVVAGVALLLVILARMTADVASSTDLLGRFASPSWEHPAGTDQFGRDVLALVGAGALSSLGLAAGVVLLSASIGTLLALLGGAGRVSRAVLVSISDVLLSVPMLVVALVVASTVGAGTGALLLGLTVLGWTPYFRVVIGQIDAARQQLWVEAAVASGAGSARVLWRHILPNVAAPLIALIASRFGHAIVSVSSLSFLGVGPQPPSAEWGAVLAAAQPHAERAPWAVIAPSCALLLTTSLAFMAGRAVNGRFKERDRQGH
jgi:peptide/nickel transport system permease protein